MGDMVLRRRVLQLYRLILRTGKQWTATDPKETAMEKEYIQMEAKRLFKRNKHLKDEDCIKLCIKEAEQRMEIALHYNNPYPRHINLPQHSLPPGGKRKLKGRERAVSQSTPLYYKSYKDEREEPPEKT